MAGAIINTVIFGEESVIVMICSWLMTLINEKMRRSYVAAAATGRGVWRKRLSVLTDDVLRSSIHDGSYRGRRTVAGIGCREMRSPQSLSC
jgi:hypothetical protein